ncbi:MAG: RluA family pseudouridine synthase [Pseudomonadota bacterium]
MIKDSQYIIITSDEEGSRLDRVIRKSYPLFKQAEIEKALRSKLIQVNQKKSSSNYRLIENDIIQITNFLVDNLIPQNKASTEITDSDVNLIKNNIIYRDADLLVINKPAGLAVQGGSKIRKSVDNIMPVYLETLETWDNLKHKLVHRLDKETSGLLLIALNNRTAQDLASAFKNHDIEKKYLAILTGKLTINNGRVSSSIDGDAITNYRVLARKRDATLVEFKPVTGKKHQLRLHSLELGFPILGDVKYDPTILNDKTAKLHLHAAEIIFPYQGRYFKLTADLPEYFKNSIKEIFGSVRI